MPPRAVSRALPCCTSPRAGLLRLNRAPLDGVNSGRQRARPLPGSRDWMHTDGRRTARVFRWAPREGGRIPMNNPWDECGVSRRDVLRLGAGGLGLGLAGGLGPCDRAGPGQPTCRCQSHLQDSRRLRVVRRQRWFEHHRSLRRSVLLPASAYDRNQGSRRPENRRAIRLAQVDERHQEALRRRESGDRARRRLRPASFSHFTSMSFWHTAAPNSGNEYGWVGRTAAGLDPAGARKTIVNISDSQTLAVRAGSTCGSYSATRRNSSVGCC